MSRVKTTAALKDVSNVTNGIETGNTNGRKPPSSAKNSDISQCVDRSTETVIIDIDGDNGGDPIWAADYVKQIYTYYRSVEFPIPNYMEKQSEVTARSRAILVDWIIEVQKRSLSSSFGVRVEPETLYLIVNVIDRFLGEKNVPLADLQLVALGALLVGTKYKETFHFTIPKLVALCDNCYDEEEVLNVETEILEALDYRLTVPCSYAFLLRFLKAACKDIPRGIKTMTILAKYILDVTLLSFDINQKYLPSELAAMSVFLARKRMKFPGPTWSGTLRYHTGYSQMKLEGIAVDFIKEKKTIHDWGLKAFKKNYGVALIDESLHRAFNSLEL